MSQPAETRKNLQTRSKRKLTLGRLQLASHRSAVGFGLVVAGHEPVIQFGLLVGDSLKKKNKISKGETLAGSTAAGPCLGGLPV
jgi:hypothetical protein